MTAPDPTNDDGTDDTTGYTAPEDADTTDTTDTDDADPAPDPRNSEAARYRIRAREAEAARDALVARVAVYQRRAVEAVAAELLAVPEDLFDYCGVDPADYFADDDHFDVEGLRADLKDMIERRPGMAKPPAPVPMQWGQYSGGLPPADGAAWSDVIRR